MPTSTATNTLEELVATAQAAVAQSIESAKRKQENAAKGAAIATELSDTLKIVAGDVAVVAATKNAADLKVQAENSRIARAAGIDPEVGANILVDTVAKLRQSNAETEANLKVYRAKNESSFFDNPLAWVADQVTLPLAEERLKGSMQQSALYSDQLVKVNNTLQESFQTTEKLKESINTASAAAATRVAAAEALITSKKYELDSLRYNLSGIEAAQNATVEQMNATYNVFNAKKSEEQLRMSQEAHDLSKERFEAETRARQDTIAATGTDKTIAEATFIKVNLGRAAMGMKPLDAKEMQYTLAKMRSGAGGDAQTYYEVGDKLASTEQTHFGNSPAGALRTLISTPHELPDIQKDVEALLGEAMKALQANPRGVSKDQATNDAFVNNFVNEQISAQYANVVPGSGNLFDVGDLSQYLTLSAIKGLPVVTKLLAPLASSGVKLDQPKIIMGLLQKAVKDGTLTVPELAGISNVYRKANDVAQATHNFRAFNIVLPNNGKNYNVKLSTFGNAVDLADPTAISNYLSREMASHFSTGAGLAEHRGPKL